MSPKRHIDAIADDGHRFYVGRIQLKEGMRKVCCDEAPSKRIPLRSILESLFQVLLQKPASVYHWDINREAMPSPRPSNHRNAPLSDP